MTDASDVVKINPIDGAELIWIPAGAFMMGSSDADLAAIIAQHPDWRLDWFLKEKPQRTVALPGFWIYRYPVTVAQFHAYCQATGRMMPDPPEWGWQETHPMVNVTWQDITDYAAWAQAAIPTEAQWEKAARGTTGNWWPWGNTWDDGACVHAGNASSTQPIGRDAANRSPYGVMDMVGNVWEWCEASPLGQYDTPPSRTPNRRPPTASGHVLRGGSWQCAFPAYLRCSFRSFECDTGFSRASHRRPTTGFRCIVSAEIAGT